MMRLPLVIGLALLSCCGGARADHWPQWRGPRGDGSVAEPGVPVEWSADHHVAWRIDLPGVGHASPIIWGTRLFLVWADDEKQSRHLRCLDSRDGRTLWDRTVLTTPTERKHKLNSFASSTPAADENRVYVSFLDGNRMFVAAYDHDGAKLWESRPGAFASVHGYCSSPIPWKDTLILNGDHDGPGFLAALDKNTGQIRWKIDRPNNTRSYCAPLVGRFAGRDQLVFAGSKSVYSYDPDSGRPLWNLDGPTDQFVASLVFNPNANLFFLTAGFPERHMMGIRPDGAGNVTATHIAWRTREDTSYVPSPVSVDRFFLVVSDKGVASCFDAASGERLWKEKIGRGHSASPIVAGGRVYFLSDEGVTTVIQPAATLQIVARNDLGSIYAQEKYVDGAMFSASPAFSDGRLYIRSQRHLWCIRQ
jgi:hypothetical protein